MPLLSACCSQLNDIIVERGGCLLSTIIIIRCSIKAVVGARAPDGPCRFAAMDDADPQAGAASEQPSALTLRAAVQQRRLAIAAANAGNPKASMNSGSRFGWQPTAPTTNAAGGAQQTPQKLTGAQKFKQSLQPAAHRQPVVESPWLVDRCYFCDLDIVPASKPIFHYPRTYALQQQRASLVYHQNCYEAVVRRSKGSTYVDEQKQLLWRNRRMFEEASMWQPTSPLVVAAVGANDAHPCSASKQGPASSASKEGAASSGSKRPREVEAPCLADSDAESD
jgi:hypothetical protein